MMSQHQPRNTSIKNGCAKVCLPKLIELNDVNQQITNCSQAFKSIDEDIAGVVPCRSGDEIPPMILPWVNVDAEKQWGNPRKTICKCWVFYIDVSLQQGSAGYP